MPLFLEHLLEQDGLVGGDEVHLVVDEPLQFVLSVNGPDVNLQLFFNLKKINEKSLYKVNL